MKVGRKFIAAIFAGAMAIASLVLFCKYIAIPNAGLLLTVVCAPSLAVIFAATGTQGIHDAIHGEGFRADREKE
jgi:hypothetical protein